MKNLHMALALATSFNLACGEDTALTSSNPHNPFEDDATTVIGASETMPIASGEVSDDGCLEVSEEICIAVPREGAYCKTGEGPVDAVVIDGEVVQVVCYEDTDAGKGPAVVVDGDSDGDLDLPQQANGSVIVFDDEPERVAVAGNVTLDANNVTLYGNGPDQSVIDGDLLITGNNARVRGVRVRGDVTISLNTAALVFVVVEGSLLAEANNALVAETTVFGDFKVTGNNTTLVNNQVGGDWDLTGSGATCEGNTAFQDANTDLIVTAEEEGDALACR